MTTVTTAADTHTPFDNGPALQVSLNITTLGLATTINAGSNINSNVIFTNGYKIFSFGATSTQNGTLSIQRYLDSAGTILQGAAITGSITANTALIASSTDGLPFQAVKINITNSGGSTATLSNVLLLMQSY